LPSAAAQQETFLGQQGAERSSKLPPGGRIRKKLYILTTGYVKQNGGFIPLGGAEIHCMFCELALHGVVAE